MNYLDSLSMLTPQQAKTVSTYFECEGNVGEIAKKLLRPYASVEKEINLAKVRTVIEMHEYKDAIPVPDYDPEEDAKYAGPSKKAKLDLLWDLAQKGSKLIYDREGNEIVMNGALSVAAVRAINDMTGDWAPKEARIEVDIKDNRSINEIKSSLDKLMNEYNTLSGALNNEVEAIEHIPSLPV